MTQSDQDRLFRSSTLGVGIWAVIAILLIAIPMRKPDVSQRFPEVKLSLATETAVETAVSQTAPANQAETAPTKKPASQTAKKNAPATKPASKPASKPAKQSVPAKSTGGLGIPNFSTPVTSSRDTNADAEYLDFASDDQRPTHESAKAGSSATRTAEFEGSAARVDSQDGGLSSATAPKAKNGAASGETAVSLDAISRDAKSSTGTASRQGTESGSATDSARGNAPGTAQGSSAKASAIQGLSFDGKNRRLVSPASPSLVLPENLARLVDSDRTVTVAFIVLADGTVPSSMVEFTPQSLLPAEIRDWLRKEFSSWRFEKSTEDGQARFAYSIRVR